uniref:Uncharacterized protein n=1 Tax=Oryza glumipatula TaxID=40148 RepID=A0A0D9ZHI6_9ORYZ
MRRSIGYGGGSARRANGGLVMRSDDEDGQNKRNNIAAERDKRQGKVKIFSSSAIKLPDGQDR